MTTQTYQPRMAASSSALRVSSPPRAGGFAAVGNLARETVALAVLVFSIPFVMLAIGLPIALIIKAVLWLAHLL